MKRFVLGLISAAAVVGLQWHSSGFGSSKRSAEAERPALTVRPATVVDGGVFRVRVTGIPDGARVRVTFRDEPLPVYVEDGVATALGGVQLDTEAGDYPLAVEVRPPADDTPRKAAARQPGLELSHTLTVAGGEYPTERLTVPESKAGGFDAETLARIKREKKTLDAIWAKTTSERYWDGGWIWPVDGKVTSAFGKRRFINGEPRSPHSGTDHRAGPGTPVRAANAGQVVLTDKQFFAGNAVVIDHGQGLYSMYFHFSETGVEEGQHVDKGEILGKVGTTGRVTAPHLHWGLRLHDKRVDPERLLELLGQQQASSP